MIQQLKKAAVLYKRYWDERAALLQAGVPYDDIDETMADKRWRAAVTVMNGQKFGKAVQALEIQIADPDVSQNVKLRAAETLGSWFQPGTASNDENKVEMAEEWPDVENV